MHLAQTGRSVVLRGRSDSLMRAIAKKRHNPTYLPNVEIPREVEATADIRRVAGCPTVLVVVPSHGFRAAVRELFAARSARRSLVLVSGTKGIEAETLARMSQVAAEEAKSSRQRVEFAAVSGPTFAEELALGSPTAAVVASSDIKLAVTLQEALSGRNLRLYSHADLAGVELARRDQERHRDRGRRGHRPGAGPQHAGGAHHPRAARDDPPRRRLRRQRRHLLGPRRPRRPGAHLHRVAVAQPARR